MPLPVPNLDDRRFQDIVDEAKNLITHYCPEWTDHNVSDPGVALIELFAWMTDLLLYRVNRVPDKLYVTFLELIGVRLRPPRAAQARVSFTLAAAPTEPFIIPRGTEVATRQTETAPAIVFTTESDLVIRQPTLIGAYTYSYGTPRDGTTAPHDLQQLARSDYRIPFFPPTLAPGDAFELAIAEDQSYHLIVLDLNCERAGGAAVNIETPPLAWQAWGGNVVGWVPCALEADETRGLNVSGEVRLRLPALVDTTFYTQTAYWIRVVLTETQAGNGGYRRSPQLEGLRMEALGGTTTARHATAVYDEVVGQSTGSPGQVFQLRHVPVLERDPALDVLTVTARGENEVSQVWQEVDSFATSQGDDLHYTLDSLDGTLTFGPALPQPDGTLYRFGAVPPRGSVLRFERYLHGGGVSGNLPPGALTVLKSSIPYVRSVTNWDPTQGGEDAQSLEDAKLRAPQALRTRTRAVTADDYEFLTQEISGVARVRCLGPGLQARLHADATTNAGRGQASPDGHLLPEPGEVFVYVLPAIAEVSGAISPQALQLPEELRQKIRNTLDARRTLGLTLEVREPAYLYVSITVTLRIVPHADARQRDVIRQMAEAALYSYLSPYQGGGPGGQGWPFGRTLHPSELYGVLLQHPAVEAVESLELARGTHAAATSLDPTRPLSVPPYALICSGTHHVSLVED